MFSRRKENWILLKKKIKALFYNNKNVLLDKESSTGDLITKHTFLN